MREQRQSRGSWDVRLTLSPPFMTLQLQSSWGSAHCAFAVDFVWITCADAHCSLNSGQSGWDCSSFVQEARFPTLGAELARQATYH